MNIAILGGTSGTGLQSVEQALARGFEVTVYARNPHNLPVHPNLTVVQGELSELAKLSDTITGKEAVICCLGTHQLRGITLMQTHLPYITQAMQQAGVNRLVLLSAFGVGNSYAKANCLAKFAYKTLVKSVYQDKAVAEQALDPSLTLTKIYPVVLTDGALENEIAVKNLTQLSHVNGLAKVSRANVAKAILDCLADPNPLGRLWWLRR